MSQERTEPTPADQTASASGAGPADETQANAAAAPAFTPADAAKRAEEAAQKAHAESGSKNVTSRQYLETSVVPLLMQGMQELVKERPEDPVQYLAAYLIKNNPKKAA
jgi:protein dpy-30